MLEKIDAEFIALFQRIVLFMDSVFCITRKTLILSFVGVNVVYVLMYIVAVVKIVPRLMVSVTADTRVLPTYTAFLGLFVSLCAMHFVSAVDGILGKEDESIHFIEENKKHRINFLVTFILTCFLAVMFRYFESSSDGNFEGFTMFGYVTFFGVACCVAVMYLVCTKLPPPLKDTSKTKLLA
jgi:hypothetical protein